MTSFEVFCGRNAFSFECCIRHQRNKVVSSTSIHPSHEWAIPRSLDLSIKEQQDSPATLEHDKKTPPHTRQSSRPVHIGVAKALCLRRSPRHNDRLTHSQFQEGKRTIWSGFLNWFANREHGSTDHSRPSVRSDPARSAASLPIRLTIQPQLPPRLPAKDHDVRATSPPPIPPLFRKAALDVPRTRRAGSNEEKMILGVKEADRQRERDAKEKHTSSLSLNASMSQAWIDVDDFCANTLKKEEVDNRVMEAQATDRIESLHDPLRGEVDVLAEAIGDFTYFMVAQLRETSRMYSTAIEQAEARHSDVYREKIIEPIEIKLRKIWAKVSAYRGQCDELIRSRNEKAALAYKAAEQISSAVKALKDPEGETSELRNRLLDLSNTIMNIVMEIEVLRQRMLQSNTPMPDSLANAAVTGLYLARPSRPGAIRSRAWTVQVGLLGHAVRKVERTRKLAGNGSTMAFADRVTMAKITFAERWAEITTLRYMSPLEDSCEDIGNHAVSTLRFQPSFISFHADSLTKTLLSKSALLGKEALAIVKKTRKIVDIYTDLIGNGNTLLCPHPDKDFHHEHVRTMRLIEQYHYAWMESRGISSAAVLAVQQVLNEDEESLSLHQSHIRRSFIDKLNPMMLKSGRELEDPLSRRGFLGARTDVLVWHGTRLLFGNRASVQPKAYLIDRSRNVKIQQPTTLSQRIIDQPSKAWLNSSLYPSAHPIVIDYVTSAQTFQHVLASLWQQEVVGFDIVAAKLRNSSRRDVHFVMMASASNVYIVDYRLYSRLERTLIRPLLQKFLEHKAILKIGMNQAKLSSLVWDEFAADLKSLHDLAQYNPPGCSNGFSGLMSLVERTFGVHNIFKLGAFDRPDSLMDVQRQFPRTFFYYLAMRAYAPLAVFYALNGSDSREKNYVRLQGHQDHVPYSPFKAELGPVNIDRCTTAFSSNLDPSSNRKAHIPATDSRHKRSSWLREMSLTMARHTLKRLPVTNIPRPEDDLVVDAKIERSMQKGVAAFYLATVFGETLDTISSYLALKDPVRWILWASKIEVLKLHPRDQAKYERVKALATEDKSAGSIKGKPVEADTEQISRSPFVQTHALDPRLRKRLSQRKPRRQGKRIRSPVSKPLSRYIPEIPLRPTLSKPDLDNYYMSSRVERPAMTPLKGKPHNVSAAAAPHLKQQSELLKDNISKPLDSLFSTIVPSKLRRVRSAPADLPERGSSVSQTEQKPEKLLRWGPLTPETKEKSTDKLEHFIQRKGKKPRARSSSSGIARRVRSTPAMKSRAPRKGGQPVAWVPFGSRT